MSRYDIAIVGGGIVGATLAAEIAGRATVVLLEAESQPGYHATGRSAAFWSETYGGPGIQPLTSASAAALRDGGFLQPLGSLHVGEPDRAEAADAFLAEFEGSGVELRRVDPRDFIPGLRDGWPIGVFEPSCAYIDVAGLHARALSEARRGGVEVRTDAALRGATRAHGRWQLDTAGGAIEAHILVNAAGAWADPVAAIAGARPLGIQPYRRTLVQLRTDPPTSEHLPHVADLGGRFYFKPEAGGKLWLSPADETPVDPGDVAPEDLDVALAIDALEHCVDWRIAAVERKWAGLRSFAPDRLPVYGFDPAVDGFFWCAGQGGFGIQTAPAGARVAAALLLDTVAHESLTGLDLGRYSPWRFSAS